MISKWIALQKTLGHVEFLFHLPRLLVVHIVPHLPLADTRLHSFDMLMPKFEGSM